MSRVVCPECNYVGMQPARKPGREWDEERMKCPRCGYECDVNGTEREGDDDFD